MKEFILLFRQPDLGYSNVSPLEVENITRKWEKWIEGISSQGKLSSRGSRLANAGKVLKPGGVITDGPFVEIKERLGGFIVIKAENLDEAVTLAHGSPVLDRDGCVEIRPLFEQG